ncbi:MAG TPA: hypothetical protein VHS78_11650 [Candidatus Elarobacter sp.]|jgi:hypothetical protein|nr:hypothetical protein [Candidatus Elarobacter sp.]
MIYHDDDDLDRALAALPLEEPPARLHARIMAATVHRPAPLVRSWEVWLVGTLLALAAWLTWTFLSSPHAVERVVSTLGTLAENTAAGGQLTMLWLAVGISSAWWLSQLSVPRTARRNVRVR